MPKSLILVLRNLNLVRAINVELGGRVNRFAVLARAAVEGAPADPGKGPWLARWELAKFEARLTWFAFMNWCQVAYVRTLQRLGLAPADLGDLEQLIAPA